MQIWNDIISFINSNGALWNFFVTIATIVYVILTHMMLKESEKARKAQSRPYVIADIAIEHIYLKMIVRNLGNDSASNVKIGVDCLKENPLSHLDFLAPGREIGNVIDYCLTGKELDSIQKVYNFKISYEDSSGTKYNQDYQINITPLINARDWGKPDNKDLVDELHDIAGKLDKSVDSLKDIAKYADKQADSIHDIERKLG